MDKVLYLSGTTRGGALEGITRSYASVLRRMGVELVEMSLLELDRLLPRLKSLDLSEVKFVLSGVGMGLDLSLKQDGKDLNLWEALGVPCITLHGDSPAYFFDRHVVRGGSFISLYAFAEHYELRRRLPKVYGPIGKLPPIVLDEMDVCDVDVAAKKRGTLLFLKNGKDPAEIREMWSTIGSPRALRAMLELADELEGSLDAATAGEIDRLVVAYFRSYELDLDSFVKLRLFLVAQLDDYVRAVKCTLMATALMDFPVEIRGNNWRHLDFSGKKAVYIDDCDYVDSIGLLRGSLGLIDMSANTASQPHDRVMRAFGSHTLCLTNRGQCALSGLPFEDQLSFRYEKEEIQTKVAALLADKTRAVEIGLATAEAFRQVHPPERSFQAMLDYADLAKLSQLPSGPGQMQDFFVWSGQSL